MNQLFLATSNLVEIYAEKSLHKTLNEFEHQLYEASSTMLKAYLNRIERRLRRNENNSYDTE